VVYSYKKRNKIIISTCIGAVVGYIIGETVNYPTLGEVLGIIICSSASYKLLLSEYSVRYKFSGFSVLRESMGSIFFGGIGGFLIGFIIWFFVVLSDPVTSLGHEETSIFFARVGILIGWIVGFVYNTCSHHVAIEQEREETREKAIESLKNVICEIRGEMSSHVSKAAELFHKAIKLSDESKSFSIAAEKTFDEGLFAPFWDSIEQSTICLYCFEKNINKILTHQDKHQELREDLMRIQSGKASNAELEEIIEVEWI